MQISLVCLLMITMSPWLSPMKRIATLPEVQASFQHGLVVFLGFIIPSLIFFWMYRKTENKA